MRVSSRARMLDLQRPRRSAMPTNTLEELGPVDIVVISYPPDAPMTGSAAQLLIDEVDKGTISVIDAMFITKAEDGTYAGFEATGLDADSVGDFRLFEGASSGLIGDDEVATAAEALEPGSSAVMIIYENHWAAPFIGAVHANGGEFIGYERIPHQSLIDAVAAS